MLLIACLFTVQVITGIVVVVFAYANSERAIRDQSTVLLMDRYKEVMARLVDLIGGAERTTLVLTQLIEDGSLDSDKDLTVERTLFSLLQASPGLARAFLVRPDGSFVQIATVIQELEVVGYVSRVKGRDKDTVVVTYRNSSFLPVERRVEQLATVGSAPRFARSDHTGANRTESYQAEQTLGNGGGATVISAAIFNGEQVATVGTEIALWQVGCHRSDAGDRRQRSQIVLGDHGSLGL